MNTDKFLKLKTKVDQLKREKDRSEGALEQLLAELRKEFGCSTLREAKEERNKLREEEQELERSFTNAMDQFEQDYPDLTKDEE